MGFEGTCILTNTAIAGNMTTSSIKVSNTLIGRGSAILNCNRLSTPAKKGESKITADGYTYAAPATSQKGVSRPSIAAMKRLGLIIFTTDIYTIPNGKMSRN